MIGMRRKRNSRAKKLLYTIVLFVVLVIVSISKFMLDDKLIQVKAKNESVKCDLEAEKNRAEELANLKLEIKTKKFIEEIAREKFGLTYQNEIVFEPEK